MTMPGWNLLEVDAQSNPILSQSVNQWYTLCPAHAIVSANLYEQ